MRKAMSNADCGDSMYGEDKTVQRLEEAVAGLLGKEAGLFGASGESSHLGRMSEFQSLLVLTTVPPPIPSGADDRPTTDSTIRRLPGTMTNLLALAAHCRRGDEIILGHQNHIFNYEVRRMGPSVCGVSVGSTNGIQTYTSPTDGPNPTTGRWSLGAAGRGLPPRADADGRE